MFPNGIGQVMSIGAGGAAGSHTMTTGTIGIKDRIIQVLVGVFSTGVFTDKTSEYTILAADTIGNTGGITSSSKIILAIVSQGA